MSPQISMQPASQVSTAGGQDKKSLFAEWALPHRDAVYTASLYLTHHQAAHVSGCPIGTLRSRLSRARRKMQKILRRGPGQKRARTWVPMEVGPSLRATG